MKEKYSKHSNLYWKELEYDPKGFDKVNKVLGLDPILTKILCANNIHTLKTQELKQFLKPAKSLLSQTQFLSDEKHLQAALNLLEKIISKKQKIMVHGDSDADGILGSSVLVVALRQLGAKVIHDFPVRPREGHGIQVRIIEKAAKEKCALLITADCGTKDIEAIKYANKVGLDVIVTDHHQLGFELPSAKAIINPLLAKKDNPDNALCGAGVAFKFMVALSKHLNVSYPKNVYRYLLALAALGTISDRMTFKVAQNRAMVYFGIQEFNKTTVPGLKALKELSTKGSSKVYAREIGRLIAPRLNAPGRIGDPEKGIPDSNMVLELLTYGVLENLEADTKDRKFKQYVSDFLKVFETQKEQKVEANPAVQKQAEIVDEVNEERKKITEKIALEIEAYIEEKQGFVEDRIIVVRGKDWNSGVIGIDTDRLRDRFKKPAIIITEYTGSDYLKASVRSVPAVNMYSFIENIQKKIMDTYQKDPFVMDVVTKEGRKTMNSFGGHAQACGFSLHKDDLDLVLSLIKESSQNIDPNHLKYEIEIIDSLSFEELNMDFFKLLFQLNPFGEGFDYPNFTIKNVTVGNKFRPFGNKYSKDKTPHIEFYIVDKSKRKNIKCVGFGLWNIFKDVIKESSHQVDLVFSVESAWTRNKKPRPYLYLNVVDIIAAK